MKISFWDAFTLMIIYAKMTDQIDIKWGWIIALSAIIGIIDGITKENQRSHSLQPIHQQLSRLPLNLTLKTLTINKHEIVCIIKKEYIIFEGS